MITGPVDYDIQGALYAATRQKEIRPDRVEITAPQHYGALLSMAQTKARLNQCIASVVYGPTASIVTSETVPFVSPERLNVGIRLIAHTKVITAHGSLSLLNIPALSSSLRIQSYYHYWYF